MNVAKQSKYPATGGGCRVAETGEPAPEPLTRTRETESREIIPEAQSPGFLEDSQIERLSNMSMGDSDFSGWPSSRPGVEDHELGSED